MFSGFSILQGHCHQEPEYNQIHEGPQGVTSPENHQQSSQTKGGVLKIPCRLFMIFLFSLSDFFLVEVVFSCDNVAVSNF